MKEYQRNHRTTADGNFAGASATTGSYENNADASLLQQETLPRSTTAANTPGAEGMTYIDIIPRFAL